MLKSAVIVGKDVTKLLSPPTRWKRKPMWLPPAKSKLFRISQRHRPSKEDFAEIQRLFNNYRTYRTSLGLHLQKVVATSQGQFDEEVVENAEEEDYNHSIELNSQWNNEVKRIRDERLATENVERRVEILQNIATKKERDRKQLENIEKKVRKAKIEAATFITRENIDRAIEEALANVVNYNEAIDTEGNTYNGMYIVEENTAQKNIRQ